VVILAFNDSECTTICPLTTTAMVDARTMLGSAADEVQLLGTTIFINRAGRIAGVHTGQYDSQGTLDGDIATYALGG
jgi:hypothetical protein